ncbi:MAG TPA: MarR family transcriptional regulator [Chitinophagaceae bacterium]|nr:MarR family transcriptional regulator [Chitinophagaceae bacterium]HRF26109.1 MarR family transcriptional regulator [Ferruginibacter sp.]
MGIEQDISQTRFRNEHHKAVVNFIYTYNWLNERLKVFFEAEGITGQQFNILRILRGAGKPISTLQIRQRMLDRMSDTSRIVDRMVIKGLVKKETCETDKRLVDVSITEKGRKLLEKFDLRQDELDAVFSRLDADEVAKLNAMLDKIRSVP